VAPGAENPVPGAIFRKNQGDTSMKGKINTDVIIGIVVLAIGAFLMMNAMTTQSAEARQFPVMILIVFMILGATLLIGGLRAGPEPVDESKPSMLEQVKYPMICFAFIVIYIVAVDIIGFIIPSLLVTAGLMWYNYARNKLALILVPCGLVGFLYVLFTFILHTKMP
jgi:hypothetical protein